MKICAMKIWHYMVLQYTRLQYHDTIQVIVPQYSDMDCVLQVPKVVYLLLLLLSLP